jgi:hypothetical protein
LHGFEIDEQRKDLTFIFFAAENGTLIPLLDFAE